MAELESIPQPSPDKTQHNPLGFLSGFLYKSFFLLLLVVLVQLFPSQAPELVNQTLLTRGWELVHLLLVGIAVSYGLFSRRNSDQTPDKDMLQKPDISQSYVASVFDEDDAESPTSVDRSKTQTWNSLYYRGKPTVVVEPENASNSSVIGKPLSLPVRRLKSPVSHADKVFDEFTLSGSRSDSVGWTKEGLLGDSFEFGARESVEKKDEGVVLPSPIPWRSRSWSGKLEAPAESGAVTPLPDPVVDTGSFRAQSVRTRRTRKMSPSPSNSPSPEFRGKTNGEELVKKRSFHKSQTPPPPPPPPPHYVFGHRSQSASEHNQLNQLKKSFMDELKDASRSGGGRESMSSTIRVPTTEENIIEKNPRPPVPPPPKNQLDKKNGSSRRFIIDSFSDNSDNESSSDAKEDGSDPKLEPEVDGNEVDKKADEFIAKFREQIRLQRIESIKRSTGQKRVAKSPKE